MNGKKVHHRNVASTHQKNMPHMHRNSSAPTPMIIGNGPEVVILCSVVTTGGTGLAGTLPTYSVGGGGGGMTGLGVDGTAAALGETTVASGLKEVASNTRMICSPKETTSLSVDERPVGGAEILQNILSALECEPRVAA
jgi:hypothetical protein